MTSFTRNLIGTVLSLITTPFILSALGEERFGAFRILLDWLSHLSLLEFGLYSATLTLMSKASTEGAESVKGTLKLIFKKYFFVLLMQIGFFVIFILGINSLIPTSPALQNEIRNSAIFMSLSLLFIVSQIFKGYLEGTQKGYLVSLVLVLFNVVYILLSVLFAHWQWGLMGQAVAYIIGLFVSLVSLIFMAPEVLKHLLNKNPGEPPHALLKNQRWSHFINELCGRISLMSDNIIVSLFMGAGPVTGFFITQKAGSMMQQQLQHLSNSSWAALSELHYQGKTQLFNQRVLNLTEMVAFSSGVLLSVVCLLNPSFVTLWTGSHTFAGLAVSNLTAINAALFSILSLWSWCFAATNLTNKMVTMSIVQGSVNVIASIVLTRVLGLAGPLYGTLIGYAGVSLFWKSSVLCKTFEIQFLKMTKAWAIPLIPPLGGSVFYVLYFGPIHAASWIEFMTYGFVLTVVLLSVCYIFLLTKETKHLFRQTLHSLMKRILNK